MLLNATGKRLLIAGMLSLVVCIAAAPSAGAAKKCKPVHAVVPGLTLGQDTIVNHLRRIRATGVGCFKARQVVRHADHKASQGLFEPPFPDAEGLWHLDWNGWAVTGDITVPRNVPDRWIAERRDK